MSSEEMSDKRPEELMPELIELIREISSNSEAVIVEGTNDSEALHRLSCTSSILVLSLEPLADFVEKTAERYKSATILTDFDRKGNVLNRRIRLLFQRRGVTVHSEYRTEFGRLMAGLKIRCIESLGSVLERVEDLLQRGIQDMRGSR